MSGALKRKRRLDLPKEAASVGAYAEYPILEAGIDPQVHISLNDGLQPFHLICDRDTLIVQVSGSGSVRFQGAAVSHFKLRSGDHVYVPAGVPHRLDAHEPSIVIRYKAANAALEGVVWYCETCDAEMYREDWRLDAETPQAGYLRLCRAYCEDMQMRTCGACGKVHAPLQLEKYQWDRLDQNLREA